MGPEGGLDWEAVPTGMDDLYFPEMRHSALGRGLTIVVSGTREATDRGKGCYVVCFDQVEAFWAVEDRYYAALGGEVGTGSVLNRTDRSSAVDRVSSLYGSSLTHFALLGGFMQYEVLSDADPRVIHYSDEAAAVKAVQEVYQ